jgi:hypothetical protein
MVKISMVMGDLDFANDRLETGHPEHLTMAVRLNIIADVSRYEDSSSRAYISSSLVYCGDHRNGASAATAQLTHTSQ